ncbi:MAG: hypothetical protein J6S69_04875 [Proteobacteria bacterium]|nr:hypothetical protein [Pseudomonadota bacterium]
MRRITFLSLVCAFCLAGCTGLDAGWKALRSGDYDEAQRHAIVALSKEPRNPEVYHLVANTALMRGQYDSALKSAEFARTLDGGSEDSEKLIREICAAKKAWACVCESGARSVARGLSMDADDEAFLREGYAALLNGGTGDGYGCYQALNDETLENIDDVKASHAASLAAQGLTQEALAIEETVADPEVSKLRAARRLFALQRSEEAAAKLRDYVGLDGDKETRIANAADVCEDYRAWSLAAEMLAMSSLPDNEVRQAVALRRAFRAEDADNLLKIHFERERSAAQVKAEVNTLLEAGYAESATEAFLTCELCNKDVELAFAVADNLADYGQLSSALQILSELGDTLENDGDAQMQLFVWYYNQQYYPQALLASERAIKQGAGNFDFHAARLHAYVNCRDIQGFERESAAWLATFEAPALEARNEIAKLESKRANWAGVLNTLEPAAAATVLDGESQTLYFQALANLKKYDALDAALDRHGADIAPLKRAQYFFTPETEKYFLKAVNPLLNGSEAEKIDGELAIAEYDLRVLGDEEKAGSAIERVLTLTNRSSYGYERVVAFTNQFGQTDKALAYARQWMDAYPAEDKPCSVLGELYLKHKFLTEAADVYTTYLNRQTDKYKALRHVYQTFTRYNAGDAGLEWTENVCAPVLKTGTNADYLQALTETRLDAYRSMRSKDAERAELLRAEVIRGFVQLLEIRPEKAISFAVDLGSVDAYEEASKAYDAAVKQDVKWRTDQQIHRAKMAVRANRDAAKIKDAVKVVDGDSKATFDLAAMLEKEQGLAYAVDVLETQLSAPKADDREKAYNYLSAWALANGDFIRARQYSAKVEESSVNHADIRLKCAKTAMAMNDWDEAVRHLTWLQASRPDARDVLETQLILARRAPEHIGAQNLFTTTLDGAEGVYHRLEWLSEFFEQYGDRSRALHYAQKAYDVLTVDNPSLKFRLIGLYLYDGALDDERRSKVDELVASLKGTSVWNVTQLVRLSEQAQDAGYAEQAQTWMKEAIAMSPDSRTLRQQKLDMALTSESLGLIALSLEEAAVPPAADMMSLLESRGAMQDAFTAIDMYAQNGEYAMALSGLLRILPAYVQGRGVVATRRALEDYVNVVSEYTPEVSRLLVNHALMGDRPCDAMAWITNVTDGTTWARTAMQCTEAASTLTGLLRSKRAAMSYRNRTNFDTQVVSAFVQQGASDLARQYAEDMGIELTPFEQFERMLYAGDALGALTNLEYASVATTEILEVMQLLAKFGYHAEAIDYAKAHITALPENDAVRAASLAVLLGAPSDAFATVLPGKDAANYAELAPEKIAKLVAVSHIVNWLASAPTYQLGSVIEVATTCAAENPASQAEILAAIDQALLNRDSINSILVTYGQHAMDAGLYDTAVAVYAKLVQAMPSSDYVHRMYSVALARLNRIDEAWHELEEGARCTNMVLDYWERSAALHADSPVSLRLKINGAHRTLHPRQAALYISAAKYALEAADIANAQTWTRTAYQYGKYSVLSGLTQAWENANALADLPDEILQADTSTTLNIEAKRAYLTGDKETAARLFAESAERAPWPLDVWMQNADFYQKTGDVPRLEQTIAQMMTAYPHAYEPYIYRAVFALTQQRTEDAWNDYQTARSLAFEMNGWHMPLVAAAAAQFNADLLKRIYNQEKASGTLNTEKWSETLNATFQNAHLAAQHQMSEQEWRQKGQTFIQKLLPKTVSAF